jgi:hypothetical protein
MKLNVLFITRKCKAPTIIFIAFFCRQREVKKTEKEDEIIGREREKEENKFVDANYLF